MKVEFLMVCRAELANVNILRETLAQTLQTDYDEINADELTDNVRLTLQRSLPDGTDETGNSFERVIYGFEIILPENTTYPQSVVNDFAGALSDTEGIEHLLKFYDELLLEQNLEYMRELFSIEMNLRKILSLIYLSAGQKSFYDLLCDDVVGARGKDDNKPTPEQMRKACENEFFHLLFSDYPKLNQRRPLSQVANIINLLLNADSFEYIKCELTRTPVETESDKDFIVSLKSLLDPVEKLRNSVAHNRTSGERIVQSYTEAKARLENECNSYLSSFIPNEHDNV